MCYKGSSVLSFLLAFLTVVRVFVRSRADTALEVLALRQQLGVLKRKRRRPRLSAPDRLFWSYCKSFGPAGPKRSSLQTQTPSSAGIAPVSASIGVGGPGGAVANRESGRKFAS